MKDPNKDVDSCICHWLRLEEVMAHELDLMFDLFRNVAFGSLYDIRKILNDELQRWISFGKRDASMTSGTAHLSKSVAPVARRYTYINDCGLPKLSP